LPTRKQRSPDCLDPHAASFALARYGRSLRFASEYRYGRIGASADAAATASKSLVAWVLFLAMLCTAPAAAGQTLDCNSASTALVTEVIPGQPRTLHVVPLAPAMPAMLTIDEHGVDLELSHSLASPAIAIATRPPRLGMWALNIARAQDWTISASANGGSGGKVRMTLNCRPDIAAASLPACTWSASMTTHLLAPLEWMLARSSPQCRALILHARAYRQAQQGRPSIAGPLYLRSASAWAALQEKLRQAAALQGAAEQATRRGEYPLTLEYAARAEAIAAASGSLYFEARARSQRCMSLQYLGQVDAAATCLQRLPDMFQRLGETSEAANIWITAAAFAADNGRRDQVEHALAAVAGFDQTRLSPMVKGRMLQQRAGLATDDGRVADAMAHLHNALVFFQQAGSARWQGNAYLRIAELYLRMGAIDEASDFVAAAIDHFPETEAAERLAQALMLRARIAALRGGDGALADVQRARHLFAHTKRQLELTYATAYAWELGHGPIVATELDQLLQAQPGLTPRARNRVRLSLASSAASRQDWKALIDALSSLDNAALNQHEALDRDQLRARWLHANDRGRDALELLRQSAEHLRSTAALASAPALRHIAGRRLLLLRQAWIDIYAATPRPARPQVEQVWHMLQSTRAMALLRTRVDQSAIVAASALRLDRALAAQLLNDGSDDTGQLTAQRSLVERYALSSHTIESTPMSMSIGQAQAQLRDTDLLLAIAMGHRYSIAVSISSRSVQVHELGASADIHQALDRLLEMLTNPTRPLADINDRASAFSRIFLPRDLPRPSGQLLVMADETTASVPLALLHWPGDDRPLVHYVAASFLSTMEATAMAAQPPHIDVLVASLRDASENSLVALPGADQEPAVVRSGLPEIWRERVRGSALSRDSLQAALASEGAWVHVAAHGSADATRQGYAGLWFASANSAPEFISWIDLISHPLRARLLLLNACRLGAGDDRGIGSNASFAQSLSSAGVHDVVAGLWQISDAAAAVWVPEFYRTISSESTPGPAQAMRAAQLRMAQSRAFRHPFYWASLVHYQN
jgi:CHAT domain-containing protein